MANEFPDSDEEYDLVEKDDFQLLKEIQAQLNSTKDSQNVQQQIPRQHSLLEKDFNQPSTSSHINESYNSNNHSLTNSKKRNYDELFGDISDLLETDVFPELNGPKEKRPCWDQADDVIKAVINARKKLHEEGCQVSTKTKYYQENKKNESISLRVPSWNFIAVTRPFDSQRIYVRIKKEKNIAIKSMTPVQNLLSVSYNQLKAEAEEIITNNTKRASLASTISFDCDKVTDTELWVDKYKPKTYLDLLSDESVNRQLLHWLKLWDKIVFNKEISSQRKKISVSAKMPKKFEYNNQNDVDSKGYPIHKIVLLTGPPGLGKTTLAHLAAKHAGYNIIEVNASDERGPDAFRQILRASTQMKAVIGNDPRPNCLILDEIDGAPAASIEELLKFVQGKSLKSRKNKMKTDKEGEICQRPIICICNELYTPSLRPLRNFALVIVVPPVSTARLVQRLMEIAQKEKLKIHQTKLLKLVQDSDCDIRSCLGALQYIGNIDTKYDMSLALKDTKRGLFDTWKEIFKVPVSKTGILSIRERMHNILKVVHRGDNEKLVQGIFHNYPENCIEKIQNVSTAMEWFQFYDQLSTTVLHLQAWSLMPYTNYTFLTCHLNLATMQIPRLSYPVITYEINQKIGKSTNILTIMRRICGMDNITLIIDITPTLPDLLNPQIRTVSGHLYTEKEKTHLSRVVNIMLDFGLNLVQEKSAEGKYEYKLDPDICEVGCFPGCKNRTKIPYAVLQIVSQELQIERVKRSTNVTNTTQNNTQKEVQSDIKQIAINTNSIQSEKSKIANNNVSITPNSSKQILKTPTQISTHRNFFASFMMNKDNNLNTNTKVSPELEKTRHIRDIIMKYGVWYKYKEETGMTGFLCTCNFHEKRCVRDAYKLLNEFADEIYGLDKDKVSNFSKEENDVINETESPENNEKDTSDEEDISTALNKEINQLKAESAKPIASRRFQMVHTGVKNVVFIKSTLPNPLELVSHIIKELDTTKKQRSRFLLRLLPIEVVCKAYMNDIKSKANIILEKYFSQEPKTYSIVFNRHSNDSIRRAEIIDDIANIIKRKNPGNKANLKNPELAIVIEIIRGICLISVAPDYYKYKKYNLLEICNKQKNTTYDKDHTIKSSDKDIEQAETPDKSTNDVEEILTRENAEDDTTKSEISSTIE
ncbi:hypothetical protein KPH14_003320 [Odynerus spinipes]|uniref:THUMP domain-containing protein n=1 Tax=Odynerus spinipes TaxID=1348599 RepID=A0AAD9RD72_9HYME|nr:hypothetical protein KPH14_003320 [Odynerus spinipes]